MNVLITGHKGYVGSVLVPYLHQTDASCDITGIDTGYFEDCLTVASGTGDVPVSHDVRADIRHLSIDHLQKIDAVIHLAAISNDPIGNSFRRATHQVNYEATIRLATLAKVAGVKTFVFASSCSVYGANADEIVSEDGSLNPLTAYARSKIDSEQALGGLADADFTVVALRFGTACGFSPRTRLDLVVNDFVASALATGTITLLSQGLAWRPFIHVEDMARTLTWAARRQTGEFSAFNVGSRQMTIKISDLAEKAASIIPGTDVEMAPNAQPDKRTYRVDFAKYQRHAPAVQPVWTIEETISDLYEKLKLAGFNDADFRSGSLIRLNKLKALRTSWIDNELYWQN